MVFSQKQAPNVLILTHNLKGLSLSFQKNRVVIELKLWPFNDASFNATYTCMTV